MEGRNLARMNAQLGAEAVSARPGEIGQQAWLVVDLRRDAGHWRRQSRDARCDRENAGRVPKTFGAVGNVQIEIERIVERAEDEASDTRGAGHVVRVRHAARALDQREHVGIGHGSAHGLYLRR